MLYFRLLYSSGNFMENMGVDGSDFKEQKEYVLLFHLYKSDFELF